jgi:hypothetical protein
MAKRGRKSRSRRPNPKSTLKEIVGKHGHKPHGPSILWPALYEHLRADGMTKTKAAMISNGMWRKKRGLPPKSVPGTKGKVRVASLTDPHVAAIMRRARNVGDQLSPAELLQRKKAAEASAAARRARSQGRPNVPGRSVGTSGRTPDSRPDASAGESWRARELEAKKRDIERRKALAAQGVQRETLTPEERKRRREKRRAERKAGKGQRRAARRQLRESAGKAVAHYFAEPAHWEFAPMTKAAQEAQRKARRGALVVHSVASRWGVGKGPHVAEVSSGGRSLSVGAREEAAEKGAALPDGKLPIRNVEELKAAIRLRGKVEGHSATEIRRHIVKRARALDAVEELPAIWKQAKQAAMKGYKCAKSGAVMPAPCAGCPNPSACAI